MSIPKVTEFPPNIQELPVKTLNIVGYTVTLERHAGPDKKRPRWNNPSGPGDSLSMAKEEVVEETSGQAWGGTIPGRPGAIGGKSGREYAVVALPKSCADRPETPQLSAGLRVKTRPESPLRGEVSRSGWAVQFSAPATADEGTRADPPRTRRATHRAVDERCRRPGTRPTRQ
jgi:hypothetical protein